MPGWCLQAARGTGMGMRMARWCVWETQHTCSCPPWWATRCGSRCGWSTGRPMWQGSTPSHTHRLTTHGGLAYPPWVCCPIRDTDCCHCLLWHHVHTSQLFYFERNPHARQVSRNPAHLHTHTRTPLGPLHAHARTRPGPLHHHTACLSAMQR